MRVEKCKWRTISQIKQLGLGINILTSRSKDDNNRVLPNRPDAIICGYPATIYYAQVLSMTKQSIYRPLGPATKTSHIHIKEDDLGTIETVEGPNTEGCMGKNLDQLYDKGYAFNFVTSQPYVVDVTNKESIGKN